MDWFLVPEPGATIQETVIHLSWVSEGLIQIIVVIFSVKFISDYFTLVLSIHFIPCFTQQEYVTQRPAGWVQEERFLIPSAGLLSER